MGRRRHPPDDREPRPDLGEACEQVVDREREGIGEQQERAGAVRHVGWVAAGEHEGRSGAYVAGPQGDRRPGLDLARAAHHRLRRAAEKDARPQHLAHGAGGVLQRAGMGRGDEEEREVGVPSHGLEQLAGHLADGMTGERVLGERRGCPQAHSGGRRVRGTTIGGLPSIEQWASIGP